MLAALITGREQVELVEMPEPVPARDQAVVDISGCGVCGTDVHAWSSGRPYNPAICGHEWAGRVRAVGADVRAVQEGDRVVIAIPAPCGVCDWCDAGLAERCRRVFDIAVGRHAGSPAHGGFARAIAVDAGRLMRTHLGLTDVDAALVEPAAVALHGVRRSSFRLGDTVLVQGGGPVGLLALQFARAGGAGHTIVVEPTPARRALALELGADDAVPPGAARTAVDEATRGRGADLVLECAGLPTLEQTAVDLTRRGGAVTLLGYPTEPAVVDVAGWLRKEVTVVTALAYERRDFAAVMELVAGGRVRLQPLHTGTIGLDQLGGVLRELAGGSSSHHKVLVDPRLV